MRYPLDNFWISQGFTPKNNPTHFGIDVATINNASGVELKAPENGVITHVFNTWKEGAYFGGNYVKMTGDSGYSYYMGHAASISVKDNQRVNEGQVIGIVGMTGQADGNHTHMEMYNSLGVAVDATKLLTKGEDMRAPTRNEIIWNYRLIGGLEPSEAEIKAYLDSGKDYLAVTEEIKKYYADRGQGYNAYKQATDKTIADLKKQLAASAKPPAAQQLKPGIYEVK